MVRACLYSLGSVLRDTRSPQPAGAFGPLSLLFLIDVLPFLYFQVLIAAAVTTKTGKSEYNPFKNYT